MNKNWYIFIVGLVLFSCRLDDDKEQNPEEPLHIVATTGIIEDCLSNIVGDSAEVSSIMGPGTDPHVYKVTPGDVELLDQADVIVANGLHLEGKMAETLEKYGREKPVLFVSDGIDKADLIKSADSDDAYDPHIWFDTKLWMTGMWQITKELGRIDTANNHYYKDNYDRYFDEVEEADKWIKTELEGVEKSTRILVTSHDAFSYFGRRYDVHVKGIQGISTLSEVGLKEISDMVDYVIDNKIKSVFIETSTSDKTAQSIVDGCKAKKYNVAIDGPLFSDALGEPGTKGGTYIGMIKENAITIVEGLK
ncbi:zinc ABC transporter substrate-binding protein [Paracrocinitomix mangrovi]|uniref:metal ABC transporter solute-binding protein, Zn/Mn family n=1 Tax=Paracrocinitomix mangrovi TaxID=2862509 RepID=UPI001C8E51BE|nr:zinc ABC transporter substrate-binding protein [Paracrocinitomix mangrovi]UKN02891.1 zinc ABC transporter substrate-binding protein [Paracrocinitomix mangrovi]